MHEDVYHLDRESTITFKFAIVSLLVFVLFAISPMQGLGQAIPQSCRFDKTNYGLHIANPAGVIDIEVLRPNILRIDVKPDGKSSPRTLVMDPDLKPSATAPIYVSETGESAQVKSSGIQAEISCGSSISISVFNAEHHKLVEQVDPFKQLHWHNVNLLHSPGQNLYGMSGLSITNNGGGLLRNNGSPVAAGVQGEAGAPFFFTTHYGVLIDSDGGGFDTRDNEVLFYGDSRTDAEYFVMAGSPMKVMSSLSILSGRPPMPPKWTLGFLNSQWGSTEAELKQVAATYRAKHIPIDGFILDYDWKAWGEGNYGEWRWNSTSGPGNVSPDKFPDGANGKFAKEMLAEGIHLAGILKPRILLYKFGTTVLDKAAAYAQAHNLWYPNEPIITDPVTGRPARDLDFSKAATRSWYWKHLEPSFNAGIVAWWDDEADYANNSPSNNFQFLNMGRMLYDGQRGYSKLRVWSINRNFYLGAQRYGYAEWSGDIQTGFQSMAHQRMRMLATIDVGEPNWSMDTGGFFGHPTPENYARWVEFATFVPIDRVHGDYGQKRQPWVYGPKAEAAATKAIRLRYKLLPYIYSYVHEATETGVGLVRPLFWEFPNDPNVANDGSSWMFGDALLVSPVVTQGESVHHVYLPHGIWYDYFRGTRLEGGKTIDYKVNPETWQDIPVFVRAGSIIATQPPEDYVGEHPIREITLDVFPAERRCKFVYYDDDGETYAYEHGFYYRQLIRASINGAVTHLDIDAPSGSFHPALRSYFIRIHGAEAAAMVSLNGQRLHETSVGELKSDSGRENVWAESRDKFGPFTEIRIPADQASDITIR